MKLKYCPECQIDKPITEFRVVPPNKDGHRGYCKVCERRKCNKYRSENRELYKEVSRRYMKRYGLTPMGRYHKLKKNSRQQGRGFTIKGDEFVSWYENQPKACYYCSVELVNGGARSGWTSLTIDRKDNDRGYDLDNIALACRRCNWMKGNWLTEQQTLEIAKKYFVL